MVKRLLLPASTILLISCGTAGAHATPAACAERLLPPSLRAATGGRAITAKDLIELRDFGQITVSPGREPFTLSPDGRFAALTLRRADSASDTYCTGILLVSLDGRRSPRLLDVGGEVIPSLSDVHGIAAIPSGLIHAAPPSWSPDGKRLAFLRRDAGKTQIWIVEVDGGPAWRLTELGTEPFGVRWSTDGHSLIFTTRKGVDAARSTIELEGRGGHLFDERFWTLSDVRPHPSASISSESNTLDLATGAVREIDADEAARRLGTGQGHPGASRWATSSSGERAWIASEHADQPRGPDVLRVEVGGNAIRCNADACLGSVTGLWWGEGATLFFLRGGTPENGGRTALFRWRAAAGSGPVKLLETEDLLLGCDLGGGALYCAQETLRQPRLIVRIDLMTGVRTPIFDPNPEFGSIRLGRTERIRWTDRNGTTTYGDLVLPQEHKPGERHPLVVVQYFSRGFLRGGIGDEYPIQLFARNGFAVLSFQMPSDAAEAAAAPDASAAQAIKVRNWAGRRRIFSALDAGIEATISRGLVDPSRIAITGMSDGASTVQFALNNSSRFKAAIMSSCCEDPSAIFIVGPSYGATVAKWNYPAAGEDGREFWRAQSLAVNAGRLKVPLLMQLAENEARMAAEGFSALKSHGVPVEAYVYPGEWHTKMHPAHRLAIYERNLAWIDFWLRGRELNDPSRNAEIQRWRGMRDRQSSAGGED